jgi:glycosyltransferase involved in cell wall biosynthesis
MTKFGIYTSFFNSKDYIDRCFQTIENVNYRNFCWHITDDFSEDNTKEVILNRIKKSPIKDRIFYYNQNYKKQMYWKPNQFFDNTFDWVVLLDSDDWFHPEALNIYNHFIDKLPNDIYLITSDFRKINESDNSLDSISYIINEKPTSEKIKNYHPKVDYLNNISYSLFGNLRCFKNNIDFKIDDNLACAEDSYRVFWCNSYGKYLHIPRPLYHWNKRKGSESHSKSPDNFNGNFDIAFNKLKKQDKGVSKYFNDIYIETSAMGSFDLDSFKTKQINLITRELSTEEKKKIEELYPEFEVFFNYPDKKLNIYCLNFTDERTLKNLNKDSINLFYFQDLDDYESNQDRDHGTSFKLKHFRELLQNILPNPFYWWLYVRHFTITSIPEKPKKDTNINLFENVLEESLVPSNNKFTYDLSDGLKVFVSGEDKEDYEFVFIDKDKQKVVFSTKETKPTGDTL